MRTCGRRLNLLRLRAQAADAVPEPERIQSSAGGVPREARAHFKFSARTDAGCAYGCAYILREIEFGATEPASRVNQPICCIFRSREERRGTTR